ncbi:GNAT family N-acetyltransferase [Tetragenococcus koreensis]|nr:GNAT family N-acetyltransferase [Tetragenococcus koreensis]
MYSCLSTSGANNSRAKKRQKEWQQALTKTDTTYFGKDNWIKAAAFYLRYQVFVLEQKIEPHLEFDELANSNAFYFVIFAQKEPIATIRYEAYDHQTIYPDRFCVAKKARNRGVGTALLKAFEQKAITQGYQYSLLSAEKPVIPFYQKNGYKTITEEFLEDGIPCVKMKKFL